MKAGENAEFKVFPYDLNGNKIAIDTNNADLALAKFTAKL